MKCLKCGHESTNPFEAYCTEVVVEKDAKVKQLDGSTKIEDMPSFCACRSRLHFDVTQKG